uniref:Uncharacterized protein n=1 Tax=Arundo donax TaxID=35708 RepID=A0A0A9GIK2_ARUDO
MSQQVALEYSQLDTKSPKVEVRQKINKAANNTFRHHRKPMTEYNKKAVYSSAPMPEVLCYTDSQTVLFYIRKTND